MSFTTGESSTTQEMRFRPTLDMGLIDDDSNDSMQSMSLASNLSFEDGTQAITVVYRQETNVAQVALLSFLGRGTFGTVYKGRLIKQEGTRYTLVGDPIAVKLMQRRSSDLEDVKKELAVMKRIGNYEHSSCTANILCYSDVFMTSPMKLDGDIMSRSYVCMVMDLIDGIDMQQWVNQIMHDEEKIPRYELVRQLYLQLARALAHIHRHGVAHGDIKPANIMISNEGEAYLVDFGLSCLLQECRKNTNGDGSLLGTPMYLPPDRERFKYRITVEAVQTYDVWALGFSFYSLIHGTDPIPPMSASLESCNVLPIVSDNQPLNWALASSLTRATSERGTAKEICTLLDTSASILAFRDFLTFWRSPFILFAGATLRGVLDGFDTLKRLSSRVYFLFADERGNRRSLASSSLRMVIKSTTEPSLRAIVPVPVKSKRVTRGWNAKTTRNAERWYHHPVTVQMVGVPPSCRMVQYQYPDKYVRHAMIFAPDDKGLYFLVALY